MENVDREDEVSPHELLEVVCKVEKEDEENYSDENGYNSEDSATPSIKAEMNRPDSSTDDEDEERDDNEEDEEEREKKKGEGEETVKYEEVSEKSEEEAERSDAEMEDDDDDDDDESYENYGHILEPVIAVDVLPGRNEDFYPEVLPDIEKPSGSRKKKNSEPKSSQNPTTPTEKEGSTGILSDLQPFSKKHANDPQKAVLLRREYYKIYRQKNIEVVRARNREYARRQRELRRMRHQVEYAKKYRLNASLERGPHTNNFMYNSEVGEIPYIDHDIPS